MNEEEFKAAINNFLMMQNNNDANFQILQAQIDKLQRQLDQLNDLKEMFRLPKPENKIVKHLERLIDEVYSWYDGQVPHHHGVVDFIGDTYITICYIDLPDPTCRHGRYQSTLWVFREYWDEVCSSCGWRTRRRVRRNNKLFSTI